MLLGVLIFKSGEKKTEIQSENPPLKKLGDDSFAEWGLCISPARGKPADASFNTVQIFVFSVQCMGLS
jgi:hypothetical protein